MTRADRAALVIGFGMGGLLDFMLLHLVLQWHHMISARLAPDDLERLQRNIFWDGVGQALVFLVVLGGVWLLLGGMRRPEPAPSRGRFGGLLILGWGLFNLVDGLLNHHLLGLHNVREGALHLHAWNLGFLLVAGVLPSLLGLWLARRGRPP